MTTPERLELCFLGGLTIRRNGAPLSAIKSRKGMALSCYLAVTRSTATRSLLAGLFWPDMEEAAARLNLRSVLHRLKPVFPYLLVTRTTVTFDVDAPHWLDVELFERHSGKSATPAQLGEAVALYKGDFLAGFDTHEFPLFDEWVMGQRARLRERVLRSLQELVRHSAAREDLPAAIDFARQLLRLEPYHETMQRELMRLLALSGDRTAAVKQYELCRAILADELGIEPAPETTHLHDLIVSGQITQVQVSVPEALQKHGLPPHNLPAETTRLVGRQAELAALAGYLADPTVRLITIVGVGGMGKTRLAIAAAAAQLDAQQDRPRFVHGIYFIALAALEAERPLAPVIAEAIGFHLAEEENPEAQLIRYLRRKSMLLVLDNFEHLLSQSGLVDQILRGAPGVTILVTSRIKLNREAEQLFLIGGLTHPTQTERAKDAGLEAMAGYEALQLFRQCARRVRPGFELDADTLPAVLTICRRVEGMPLAIILAATWLETLSPDQIVEGMQLDLDFLSGVMGDMPPRQQSMRAAFMHSWRLLSERERELFPQLSVFRGGFTREAAEAVTGATLRDLRALVHKSLITVSAKHRYEIHELLCQFGAEILHGMSGREYAVRERHSRYYCALLAEHTAQWHGARQLETLSLITVESGNANRAWQWAVEQKKWAWLSPALPSWCQYHRWRGRMADGEALCADIVERMERARLAGDDIAAPGLRLWARAMALRGTFTVARHTAISRLYRSLSLLERPELGALDIRSDLALVHRALGNTYYSLDRKRAREHLERSLALYRELGTEWAPAKVLTDLAHLDWATGDYALAQERIEAGLALHVARGDRRAELGSKSSLAWIQQGLGRLDEAEQLRREVLTLSRQLKDRSFRATHLANLAYTLQGQGKLVESQRAAKEALWLCQEDGRRDTEGYARLALGLALLYRGYYDRAKRELKRALDMVRQSNNAGVEATVHWALGCVALTTGDYDGAQSAFVSSRTFYKGVHDNLIGLALNGLAYTSCLRDDLPEARLQFIAVLTYVLPLHDYSQLTMGLPGIALYLARTGRAARAQAVWVRAHHDPLLAVSQWHRDVIARAQAAQRRPDPFADLAPTSSAPENLWSMAEVLREEL